MPRKVRQLKADLRKAGFAWRPAKGSHGVWTHPLLPSVSVTVSGNDGDDARDYQEKQVAAALDELRRVKESQP